MKTLKWKGRGRYGKAQKAVDAGSPFVLEVDGLAAAALARVLGLNAPGATVGLTGLEVGLVVALATLATLGALVAYAIHEGYDDIEGERRADGSLWLRFRKKKR